MPASAVLLCLKMRQKGIKKLPVVKRGNCFSDNRLKALTQDAFLQLIWNEEYVLLFFIFENASKH